MQANPTSREVGDAPVAPNRLPEPPAARWARPFVRFLQIESASGVVLLVCTMVALVLANSAWSSSFADFWHTRIVIGIGDFEFAKSLEWWVNDGLMTLFFFVVGLEIKRELVAGELRDPRKAALPVMAALGGMVAPACIYWWFPRGQQGESGWGIPMATDIAFVVGFLALLGPRVPIGLKILLLSLAIADDIGAVLVIAVFYSTDIALPMLGLAAAGFGVTLFFNRIGVRRVPIYVIVGAGVWLAFLKSGVHPTVAGVLLGLLTPASAWVGDRALIDVVGDVWNSLRTDQDGNPEFHHKPLLGQLELAARESTSPLERLETGLHPWVAFVVMPTFALANAGVTIQPSAIAHPVALAVAAGLVIGKPLGIVAFSWLAVRVGLARLPSGVNWQIMIGAGWLAGIGFTMSLFVANLALEDALLDAGKIGTLTGSAVSAVVGCTLLIVFLPRHTAAVPPANERLAIRPESLPPPPA
jgi:NhaA family Na+:H+ antiporter